MAAAQPRVSYYWSHEQIHPRPQQTRYISYLKGLEGGISISIKSQLGVIIMKNYYGDVCLLLLKSWVRLEKVSLGYNTQVSAYFLMSLFFFFFWGFINKLLLVNH